MQIRNVFAGPYLERASHLRADPAWFGSALADERSRIVPVWNSRNLIADGVPDDAGGPHAVLLELKRIYQPRDGNDELIP